MNESLIRATMEYITKHENQWNQDHYEINGRLVGGGCGTQRCFFGWAIWIAHPAAPSVYNVPRVYEEGSFSVGRELLGLDGHQAEMIAYSPPKLSLEEFKKMVMDVTGIQDL